MISRSQFNLFLIVLVVALIAGNLFHGRRDPEQRNYEFLPTMLHSVAYESFTANEDLPLGMTMQTPPEGTAARGWVPLHFAATPEDALRAGRELTDPLATDEAAVDRSLEEGEQLYQIYCRVCHGILGAGDGTVAQRGFPAPPQLYAENALGMLDGQIFHIITFGGENMPGHASQIEPDERWQLVRYVRLLQREGLERTGGVPPPPPEEEPSGEAPVAAAEEVAP